MVEKPVAENSLANASAPSNKFKRAALTVLVVALLVVYAFATTACASDKSTSSTSKANYIFVCPFTENPYWQNCKRGIEDADEAFSVHTEIIGPATPANFVEEMPGYMKEAIDADPDGILLYAGVPEVAALINTAVEHGIPVMTIDADAPDTKRLSYIGTDLYEMGYTCGETMVELTNGKAQVAYVCTAKNIENEAFVYQAFKDAIHDYSMPVVVEAEGGNSAEKAAEVTRKIIEENPNITAIFATAGQNGTGIARACRDLDRDDIKVIALEDTDENLELLRAGYIDVLYAQNPYQMGYQAVKLMKSYTEDEASVKSTVSTGVVKITRENVDSYRN